MLAAVGHPVVELARVRFGPVELGDLEPGAHRPLTAEERTGLRRMVQSASDRKPKSASEEESNP